MTQNIFANKLLVTPDFKVLDSNVFLVLQKHNSFCIAVSRIIMKINNI